MTLYAGIKQDNRTYFSTFGRKHIVYGYRSCHFFSQSKAQTFSWSTCILFWYSSKAQFPSSNYGSKLNSVPIYLPLMDLLFGLYKPNYKIFRDKKTILLVLN